MVGTSPGLTAALALDAVVTAVLPLAVLVAMGHLVGEIPAAVSAGAHSEPARRAMRSLIGVGALFFVSMLAGPLHDALAATVKTRVTHSLQARLIDAVTRPAGTEHLEDPSTLDRLALAQGSLMTFSPADAPVTLARVLGYRVTWLAACAVIATFRWWLALVLIVVWQVVRGPVLRVVRENVLALGGNASLMRRADYYRSLSTTPAAAKELRAFGLQRWLVDRYRESWIEGMAEVWRIRAGMTATLTWVGATIMVVYVGACAVIARAAYEGQIDLQQVAILVPMLFMTMTNGGVSFEDLSLEWQLSSLPTLDDLERDMTTAASAPTGLQPAVEPRSSIRFERVTFRYPGSERDVLRGLDLDLRVGTSTALVGANGAGKTTIVKLLARLQEPTDGRIEVDGVPFSALSAAAWQRQVAVVFQDFLRLPLSARDNIALGSPAHQDDHRGVVDAAERAGIRSFVEGLPRGWSTTLSKQFTGGTDLSGGQWQRIALARALFAADHGAEVLILDEPTSWMDVRGEAEFFDRFLELTQELTTLVISHRFSTVRLADNICVLRDGRVVEQGSHDDLVDADGLYARMFRVQAAQFM